MKNLANRAGAEEASNVSKMIIVVSVVMAVAATAGIVSGVTSATLWALAVGCPSAMLCILEILSIKYRKHLGLNVRPNFVLAIAAGVYTMVMLWWALN